MTLIDIAMVMMVIGLLMAPALSSYKQWINDKEVGATQSNRLGIHKAIADYYFENGKYPCPADPTLGPDNAAYGDSDCAATDVGGGVLVGAVPFATLKIPTDLSMDGWHHKFKYAVTQTQTVAATFGGGGSLIVRSIQQLGPTCRPDLPIAVTNSVHYMLVSLGGTGRGAYTAEGKPLQACPVAGATADAENCLDNNTFFADTCAVSDRNNANFFDDMVDFKTSNPSRIWTYADATDIFSSIPNVGINNPNPQVSLDVMGNIRAEDVNTSQICDSTGANCFTPDLIGGFSSLMNCTGSTAIGKIGSSKVNCDATLTVTPKTCSGSQKVVGIDATGKVICGS